MSISLIFSGMVHYWVHGLSFLVSSLGYWVMALFLSSGYRLNLLICFKKLQVEDMLKRSFAEFHAQKKLPEKQQLLMRKLAQQTKTIE